MNEPKTPQKARPRLGSRSRTAEASFTSPSKRTDTAESDVGSPKKQKQHHLPFFHTAHHDHHHRPHLHYKSKRVDDVGSKTNLRQHLPNVHPVEGLATMISNHSEPKPGLGSQAPTRRHSQELSGESQLVKLPSRPIRPEDVEREREKGILRERELRSSLNELSELATGTTQRLDSAFYTLLEKVGQLRSTITSLQELSESSHELYDNFRRDIDSAEKEFTGQIDAFDGFKGQQDEVQKLLDRITTSKQQSETLGARLEAARKRVELWETREKEWQKKTSKRLTFSWVLTLTFVTLVVGIVIWKRFAPALFHLNMVPSSIDQSVSMPDFIVNDLAALRSESKSTEYLNHTEDRSILPSDRRLANFEEL